MGDGLGLAATLAAAPFASSAVCLGGAGVEYAYRAGYDSRSRVSVNHIVDDRVCSALLEKPHMTDESSGVVRGER